MTAQERHARTVQLVRASLLALPPKGTIPLALRAVSERALGIRR